MSSKSLMQKDLEEAADYNLSLEEKVYKSNKISLDLLAQVKHLKLGLDFFGQYYQVYKGDKYDTSTRPWRNTSTGLLTKFLCQTSSRKSLRVFTLLDLKRQL